MCLNVCLVIRCRILNFICSLFCLNLLIMRVLLKVLMICESVRVRCMSLLNGLGLWMRLIGVLVVLLEVRVVVLVLFRFLRWTFGLLLRMNLLLDLILRNVRALVCRLLVLVVIVLRLRLFILLMILFRFVYMRLLRVKVVLVMMG